MATQHDQITDESSLLFLAEAKKAFIARYRNGDVEPSFSYKAVTDEGGKAGWVLSLKVPSNRPGQELQELPSRDLLSDLQAGFAAMGFKDAGLKKHVTKGVFVPHTLLAIDVPMAIGFDGNSMRIAAFSLALPPKNAVNKLP